MADAGFLEAAVGKTEQPSALAPVAKLCATAAGIEVSRQGSVLDPDDHQVLEVEDLGRVEEPMVLRLLGQLDDVVGILDILIVGTVNCRLESTYGVGQIRPADLTEPGQASDHTSELPTHLLVHRLQVVDPVLLIHDDGTNTVHQIGTCHLDALLGAVDLPFAEAKVVLL